MNIPRFIVSLIGAFAFAAANVPASAQVRPTSNVTGNWSVSASGPHFRSGTYQFTQANETVIGTNAAGGQMHGTVSGDQEIDGKWRGPTGETGWFRLQFTQDGKSFSGEYGYKGRKSEGMLIGRKSP
ncbi:MAG TPA: hypothetical protein VMA36_15875 [Candidatus Limnocylindria bacterium]|jgi:hypothetical protein|nr:hypothetical protein [Candidatus Limnocylindria bacterium]